jgi:hypothetical protein
VREGLFARCIFIRAKEFAMQMKPFSRFSSFPSHETVFDSRTLRSHAHFVVGGCLEVLIACVFVAAALIQVKLNMGTEAMDFVIFILNFVRSP